LKDSIVNIFTKLTLELKINFDEEMFDFCIYKLRATRNEIISRSEGLMKKNTKLNEQAVSVFAWTYVNDSNKFSFKLFSKNAVLIKRT